MSEVHEYTNLMNFLNSPDEFTEVYERDIAITDKENPPVISIGHTQCSDYLFIDIGSLKSPDLNKILVMHSSLLELRKDEKIS